MFYDRKIRYWDYLEQGERVRGAGFVKVEVLDNRFNVQIQVCGLRQWGDISRDVRISDGKRESVLGNIVLENGRGQLVIRGLDAGRLGKSESGSNGLEPGGIPYSELASFHIHLTPKKELICQWARQKETQKEPAQKEQESYVLHAAESAPRQNIMEPLLSPEEFSAQKENAPRAPREDLSQENPTIPEQLYEDKWQQLSSIYPHIAPFGDERDYLSIGPSDFVVLQKQYHRLVTNSFLLHGYYNYAHLILSRVERFGEIRYYVGVPGNFYEKERQVAVMFGFESFECKREPVQMGDFGYYCIRVDI